MKLNINNNYKYTICGDMLTLSTDIFSNRWKGLLSIVMDGISGFDKSDLHPPLIIKIYDVKESEELNVDIDKYLNVHLNQNLKYSVQKQEEEIKNWKLAYQFVISFAMVVVALVTIITVSAALSNGYFWMVVLVPVYLILSGIISKYKRYIRILDTIETV